VRKKILAMLATLGIAVTLAAAVASPAQAAQSDCPSSSGGITVVGCFYTHSNYGTPLWIVTTSQGCKNFTSTWNDRASSAWNRTVAGSSGAYLIRIWVDGNCSGQSAHFVPGRADSGFSWYWNDAASSYAVYPCSSVSEC